MRAVWSFWTKPFHAFYGGLWSSEKHHLLAWVLSVETARKHYPDTSLFTDDRGARVLVDALRLPFTELSTELGRVADNGHEWFNLGKLYAYRAQTAPFVHVDYDVFLWKRLPVWAETAAMFAQSPEWLPGMQPFYRPDACTQAIRSTGGWLPEEWHWYLSIGGNVAVNCGILGGRDVAFLSYYADLAIRIIEHPNNQAAWSSLKANVADAILVEQFFLGACVDYHRGRAGSRFQDLKVAYLFPTFDHAFDEERAAALGFTHLINGAKTNAALLARLERRVEQDYPEHYERCLRYVADRAPC